MPVGGGVPILLLALHPVIVKLHWFLVEKLKSFPLRLLDGVPAPLGVRGTGLGSTSARAALHPSS